MMKESSLAVSVFPAALMLTLSVMTAGLGAVPIATAAPAANRLPDPDAEHRSAVAQARRGEYEAALKRLAALLEAYPENSLFRYDYISVLAWAGRDEEVSRQSARIDFSRAPAYVLKAIGKSMRNRQQPERAIEAYQAVLKRDPRDRQARLGLALSLAEAKRPARADAQMAKLLEDSPTSVELLAAQAYVKEAAHDYAGALDAYDRLLRVDPGHRGARRGRVIALLRLGAPHEALRLARRDPEVFSAEDWRRMAGDQVAREIRWGRLPWQNPLERYRSTDAAIDTLQRDYARIKDEKSPAALRNRFDLIAAYRNRGFMDEATALYERLREQGVSKFPPYVLAAAGDAYLSLRQPRQAIALLEQSTRDYPDELDARYALYYAYLEAGEYEKSLQYIDRLAASLPPWTWPAGSNRREANLDKLYAQSVAAMARAYLGQLDEAEGMLDALLARAPGSVDARASRGKVYLWRGWPRRAEGEFRAVLAMEPDNLDARGGLVDALAARGDHAAADAALAPLTRSHGDAPQVRNLARDAELRRMREFWMEINGGTSSSIYQGSSDLGFSAYYYDRQWNPGLRPYVYLTYKEANFPEQAVSRNRLAAGVEYRQRDMTLRGGIGDGDGSTGFVLRGEWMPTDHWRNRLSLQSYSDETPLRADLTGVEAWSLDAGTEFRFHESRSLGLSLQYMGFDDGNQRNTLTASARQRLVNGLRYRLEGQLFFYHQGNTLANTAYFNPIQQDSLELTLNNDWLTYRHYEKSLSQRFVVTAGPTYQQGYGSKLTWSLAYEHRWSFSRRLSMGYGISRARPIYDGVREYATRGFLNLYARF